jgi:hypothetical protein
VELFLDEVAVDTDTLTTESVEDTLRHIQTNVCAPGRLIVCVKCNGEEIAGEVLAETLAKPISEFQRLDVFSTTPTQLVQETMKHATSSLEQTGSACQKAAELLTEGKRTEGIKALSECLQSWQQIHEAIIKGFAVLELDPQTEQINDKSLVEMLETPKEMLNQIKQALKSQDDVLLADVLQYEFSDAANQWHSVVSWLNQKALDQIEEQA